MRKTRIICKLDRLRESEVIEKMILAGTDTFRLNRARETRVGARHRPRVRALARKHQRSVGSSSTPKVGDSDRGLAQDLKLAVGDPLEITVGGATALEPNSITVNYDGLIDDVSVGDVVLLDNGLMQVRVQEKRDHRIRTAVLTSGTLGSRRHINLPGVHVNLPALTEKDLADVALGIELKVDFVALSFARKKEDLDQLRRLLRKGGSSAAVVAKIESASAVDDLDKMIRAADVILVARGDLGIECPMENANQGDREALPPIGKTVIVATRCSSRDRTPVRPAAEVGCGQAVLNKPRPSCHGRNDERRYPVTVSKCSTVSRSESSAARRAGYGKDALSKMRQRQSRPRPLAIRAPPRRGITARHDGALVSNLRPGHAPIFASAKRSGLFQSHCWGVFPVLDLTNMRTRQSKRPKNI